MELVISNKQNKVKLEMGKLKKTLNYLLSLILVSLKEKSGLGFVNEFEKRGILSLVLVSNRQIRKINSKFRGKDKATDVIAFPLTFEPPGEAYPWEIGEIFISVEKAKKQANSYGHSFKREIAFLFVHGVLHIFGFDHDNLDKEKEMFKLQKDILESAGITK